MRTNPNAKWRGYFSHPIRGVKGDKATDIDMAENCCRCSTFAHNILLNFDGVDLYIPADHDEAIGLALKHSMLSVKQILVLDCMILDGCDFMFVYTPDGHISKGMQIEIDYAVAHKIPMFFASDFCQHTVNEFDVFLGRLP